MLPSLGCFSSLDCPFYKGGVGQCSRPYCHYRHAKRDPNAPPEPTEDILGLVPTPEQVQAEKTVTPGPSSEVTYASRAAKYKAEVEAAPAYNPTPIAILKSSHLPIPYTPTAPTRSTIRKSKPSAEYVPRSIGTSRPTYPPYSPSSISSLKSAKLDDPLKNPLYEIYGPEGAQYSPNDVEPVETGYSYAPSKSASYSPYSPSSEYVPTSSTSSEPSAPVSYNPQFSPSDSQQSDEDDNVDLAEETAAQTNGDLDGGTSLLDLALTELDNLDIEFEDSDKDEGNRAEKVKKPDNEIVKDKSSKSRSKESEKSSSKHSSSKHKSKSSHSDSSHRGEKRTGSSSNSESKRLKTSHDESNKNGHKEEKSSSSSKKSSHDSHSRDKKSSSQSSSSKSKPSSSKSSSKSHSSSSTESRKRTHSDRKSKNESSSSSRSKHRDKEKERERHKEKDGHRSKEKGKSSSHRSSESKAGKDTVSVDDQLTEEEIRRIEEELDASLEDEDTIEQQCYEMFSEFSESMQNQTNTSNNTEDQRVSVSETQQTVSGKKRVAHQSAHTSVEPQQKPVSTLAKKSSPYQVLRDRWEMLKKQKSETLTDKSSLAIAPSSVPKALPPTPYSAVNAAPAALPGKKRIASVSNVAMLLKPPPTKKTAECSSTSSGTPPNRSYDQKSQRVDEFGRLVKVRVAHAPNMDAPVMRKPVVNPSDCRKFKVATRQANVNKLYQAYIDAGFGEASHDMALESEKSSTQGTESLGVYSHRIIQILKDLRACAESSQNGPKLDGLSGVPNRVVSHNAMLAGKLGSKVSWSIQTSKKETETKLTSLTLYEKLKPYILTKEQLEENSYPIASNEKGVALLKPGRYRNVQQPQDKKQRICVRCLKLYAVNKHGEQVKEEECFYHWGRKITTRKFRDAETKYSCCEGTGGGCSVAPYHVYEPNSERSGGFMSTLSKPHMEADPGVYALDCEMCYTTAGLELTRVTVIKDDLSTTYETLVKPSHKILDYNTRFSGITEEDMKNVSTSILQVQATLLGMFCDKTILIGHSLESDMKALKLIHPTVVDTSVVFPHKMGPPYKRALRTLSADYLRKIIQNDVGGHDSKEDAVAAMELMLWKVKEDEKSR